MKSSTNLKIKLQTKHFYSPFGSLTEKKKRVKIMSKRTRQYIVILAAVIAYYLVHEGAHLLYALFTGGSGRSNLWGLACRSMFSVNA